MIWRKIILMTVFLFGMAVPHALAQRSFEVTPFFGGRFGGTIDESSAINPSVAYDYISIKSSFNYGGLFDYTIFPNFQAEFMFNRQPTVFAGHDLGTNTRVDLADGSLDEYEFGGLYQFKAVDANFKPFVVGGLGFTHFDPSNLFGFANRFSFNLGGGVKYFFSDHFGVRLEVRWSPSHTTTGVGTFCDPFYGCYQAAAANTAEQGQINLGFIFRSHRPNP